MSECICVNGRLWFIIQGLDLMHKFHCLQMQLNTYPNENNGIVGLMRMRVSSFTRVRGRGRSGFFF